MIYVLRFFEVETAYAHSHGPGLFSEVHPALKNGCTSQKSYKLPFILLFIHIWYPYSLLYDYCAMPVSVLAVLRGYFGDY